MSIAVCCCLHHDCLYRLIIPCTMSRWFLIFIVKGKTKINRIIFRNGTFIPKYKYHKFTRLKSWPDCPACNIHLSIFPRLKCSPCLVTRLESPGISLLDTQVIKDNIGNRKSILPLKSLLPSPPCQ